MSFCFVKMTSSEKDPVSQGKKEADCQVWCNSSFLTRLLSYKHLIQFPILKCLTRQHGQTPVSTQ